MKANNSFHPGAEFSLAPKAKKLKDRSELNVWLNAPAGYVYLPSSVVAEIDNLLPKVKQSRADGKVSSTRVRDSVRVTNIHFYKSPQADPAAWLVGRLVAKLSLVDEMSPLGITRNYLPIGDICLLFDPYTRRPQSILYCEAFPTLTKEVAAYIAALSVEKMHHQQRLAQ